MREESTVSKEEFWRRKLFNYAIIFTYKSGVNEFASKVSFDLKGGFKATMAPEATKIDATCRLAHDYHVDDKSQSHTTSLYSPSFEKGGGVPNKFSQVLAETNFKINFFFQNRI